MSWPATSLYVELTLEHVPANEEWEGSATPIIVRREHATAETKNEELGTLNYCGPLSGVLEAIRRDLHPIGAQVREEDTDGGDDPDVPIVVGITESCTRLRTFPASGEGLKQASEFIGTLEGHLEGIYYIDAPEWLTNP